VILAVAVGLAAAVGAVCRYALDLVIQHRHDSILPWGTFTINASGSLLLGLVTGLGLHHGLPHAATVVLAAGFAGGYTTWSTWAWESLAMAEDGSRVEGTANIAGSLVVGLAAAGVGLALAAA